MARCPFCNDGRGIHSVASDRNRRWYGPFGQLVEAEDRAERTGRDWYHCGHCRPGGRLVHGSR